MQEKKPKLASFVLIGLVLALFFACAVSVAGVGDREDGAEESKNPHQAEKDNVAESNVDVTASSTTCNSCSDCTNKLNGKYDTVKLTKDLINVKGSCITFGANNVVFDGNGHKIDGDDTGEFESGITMSSKSGNTIKNCEITDFESGITLYGSSKNKIYDNEVCSNYYDGIWISTNSDSNNIHDNLIEDNGNYGVYFSSDSNNNIFSKNVVCSNPTDIHDADKNSGDDNTCDTAHNWNDDGTNGCTYSCPAEKPDLIITEIICDRANDRIGYKIKNIGDATASKGHYTTLFVDGAFQIKEQVNVNLAPKASSQRYFDYYSWQCTPAQDTVKVCADYGNFVDESNEKNNCREETCECVVEKPDLVITDIWNVSNTIYYKVKNQGKATAGVSYTSLSIDGVFKTKDYVASLASGATRTESFNYQWACTPPSDMVKVCADYLNGVAESNEKNNCREETWQCAPVKLPDLVITDVSHDGGTICYEIKNIGDATAQKGHYTTLHVDGAYKIKEQVDVDLGPGASVKRRFDHYSWSCTAPEDKLKVCADYGDFVDESNEKNNCREETCECVVEKPDLVITDIWNVSNTIYYKVKNQGKATAGVSYTSLSIDGVFKVKDYVASLASGATRTESFNYQWACTPPSDMVKVCADYLNGVAESNEKNNCKSETYACVEKPDLVITDIQCDNENHRIGYKIKNVGDATASKGHYTTLFVDGAFKIKEQVNVNLAPGAVSQRYFDYYSWQCTSPQDTVKVCADYGDFVDESNEKNNCREETCECAPPEKPDLIITDIWSEDSNICYQVRNIGNATVPKGHYTALSIDGEPVVNDLVDVELAPKERLKHCFNYAWQCSPPDDTITVCADYKDVVNEADETNNCRNETWKCDTTPPVIVSGPVISEITQSSVAISWTTDEDSDSVVEFGRTAGMYGDQKFSLKMKQEHKVILTDLLPSTTYRYVVESTDASKNTVVSRDGLFETSPLPDDEPPVVHSLDVTRGKGDFLYYEMSADATDNIGVERVEFYMDDMLIGTDYSEPYLYPLAPAYVNMTRAEFFEEHTVEAVAFDGRGMSLLDRLFDAPFECEDIDLEMRDPNSDHTIYIEGATVPAGTIVPIVVYAARVQNGSCVFGDCEPPMAFPISQVEFYVNHAPISHTSSFLVHTGNWDASGLPPGTYTIRVDAIASEDCKQTIIRDVSVVRGEPRLDVSRDVTRIGNYFRVELTVSNSVLGTASAVFDRIEDNVDGFQPIRKSDAAEHYEVTFDCSPNARSCNIEIDPSSDTGGASVTLEPGEDLTVEYLVVPVLYPDSVAPEYAIGADQVRVVDYLAVRPESFDEPCVYTSDERRLDTEVDLAKAASDYLIVTDPELLFDLNAVADVNDLLSAMAELAQLKTGILGYVSGSDSGDPHGVDDLIEDWGSGMNCSGTECNYLSDGYLLIVGETEIVPALGTSYALLWNRDIGNIDYTDRAYADTAGSYADPELSIGRIIGDSAALLQNPIQTSIDIARGDKEFDNSDALAVSGGNGRFAEARRSVAGKLGGEGYSVTQVHSSETEFFSHARDKDVIFLAGHGNWNVWDGINTSEVSSNFSPGDARPLVYAYSCLTGRYPEGTTLAEAFLNKEASAYIGATESSISPWAKRLAENYFSKLEPGRTVGSALKHAKRHRLGVNPHAWDLNYNRYNCAIFHLFGDPKLEPTWMSASAAESQMKKASSAATSSMKGTLSSVEVSIPDYQLTTVDREDHVRIPGGRMIFVPGQPSVPSFSTLIDYPVGYRVQDITLTERGGLLTETGLNIPDVFTSIDGNNVSEVHQVVGGSEWWPDRDFDWIIRESPNGTSTLVIEMYPFYYNPLTTDVMFYKNYSFDINYTTSTVEIESLTTDKNVYPEGDNILIDLWLNNSGDAQDVIVDAVVRADSTDGVASGLLLRTLKDFAGLASFSPQWDSDGIEPGYYFVEVTMKDTSGNVLDRKTEMFRLGISSGEIASFTATPECFEIGDGVEIEMAFENTGTVNITGTAIIKVLNSTGYATEEFRHNVTNLTPSGSVSFSDEWGTSGAEESSYKIIGYALYDSKATEPVSVTVSTQAKIFDTGPGTYPSVMGNHTGTIKPNHTVIATKMYTYPCAGTGGHTEYARIWNDTWSATAKWEGYANDWHNVSFDKTVVLLANESYNYCIRTGSYPQIHHTDELEVDDGIIRCAKFIDANGKVYYDRIPAIRLE